MKAFRYGRDPLCWTACGLYLLNRAWLRGHVGGPFLTGRFNDLLVVPAALPWVLWIHQLLGWRPVADAPTAGEILLHVGVWSLACEYLGPRLFPHTVGDWGDVLCYAAGGAMAWVVWRGRNRAAGAGRG